MARLPSHREGAVLVGHLEDRRRGVVAVVGGGDASALDVQVHLAIEARLRGSVPNVGVSIRFWRVGEARPRKTVIV